jgi:gas vesicle protein
VIIHSFLLKRKLNYAIKELGDVKDSIDSLVHDVFEKIENESKYLNHYIDDCDKDLRLKIKEVQDESKINIQIINNIKKIQERVKDYVETIMLINLK